MIKYQIAISIKNDIFSDVDILVAQKGLDLSTNIPSNMKKPSMISR